MTREEAIEILEDLDGYFSDNQGRDYDEAFRMAIEALSEPSIVRCKECKYSEKCCQNIIDDPDGVPTEITSCSHGERREP